MSRRLTAKEIKHDIREDEVRTFLARVFLVLEEHPKLVLAGVGGIVVLALLGSGAYAYLDGQRQAANDRLAAAIKIYEAPVVADGAKPDDPDSPSFASEEARRERAKEAFAEVAGVGAKVAGDVAGLYLAEIALAEGDADTARSYWESFLEKHDDHVLALSVRLNLIRLDRDGGRAAEVAAELQSQLDSPEKNLPEDVLLFELALTREALGETGEALELYQRIVDEHPQSAYAGRARQMTASLGS